ncbi:MAG: aromatic acid/H+ symport family MFS transporter [Pseudomonadota bacterium]|nr:aromatic acid/H+ symport family MFS transporter [Pseudomonadota bacterium]
MPVLDTKKLIDDGSIGALQITVVVLCGFIVALEGFDAQAIGYVAPSLSREWGLHPGDLGPAISLGLVGLMAGALFIAPLADRVGRRPILIVSTVLFGLGTLATAWARDLTGLTILRIVTGLGIGGAMPNALALTSEFLPRRRRAFLIVMMFNGFNIGSMAGGILSAHFTQTLGWQAVFVIGGILPLLLAPLLAFVPESLTFLAADPTPKAQQRLNALIKRLRPNLDWTQPVEIKASEPPPHRKDVRALFSRGLALTTCLLWIIFFMSLLDVYMLVSWVPTALHVAGAPPAAAITAGILLQVGAIAASVPIGWALDRFGPLVALGPSYFLAAVCIACIGIFSSNTLLTQVIAFGAGFGLIGGQAGANAVATVSYPTQLRSTGVGWALGIGRIGSIVGPIGGGILLNAHVSIQHIFYLSAVPAMVATAAIIGLAFRPGDSSPAAGDG